MELRVLRLNIDFQWKKRGLAVFTVTQKSLLNRNTLRALVNTIAASNKVMRGLKFDVKWNNGVNWLFEIYWSPRKFLFRSQLFNWRVVENEINGM